VTADLPLALQLARQCPAFFNEWDHKRFEAEALLSRAERTPNTNEAMSLLAQSAAIFQTLPLTTAKVAEIVYM
jgi:hypothetical protein